MADYVSPFKTNNQPSNQALSGSAGSTEYYVSPFKSSPYTADYWTRKKKIDETNAVINDYNNLYNLDVQQQYETVNKMRTMNLITEQQRKDLHMGIALNDRKKQGQQPFDYQPQTIPVEKFLDTRNPAINLINKTINYVSGNQQPRENTLAEYVNANSNIPYISKKEQDNINNLATKINTSTGAGIPEYDKAIEEAKLSAKAKMDSLAFFYTPKLFVETYNSLGEFEQRRLRENLSNVANTYADSSDKELQQVANNAAVTLTYLTNPKDEIKSGLAKSLAINVNDMPDVLNKGSWATFTADLTKGIVSGLDTYRQKVSSSISALATGQDRYTQLDKAFQKGEISKSEYEITKARLDKWFDETFGKEPDLKRRWAVAVGTGAETISYFIPGASFLKIGGPFILKEMLVDVGANAAAGLVASLNQYRKDRPITWKDAFSNAGVSALLASLPYLAKGISRAVQGGVGNIKIRKNLAASVEANNVYQLMADVDNATTNVEAVKALDNAIGEKVPQEVRQTVIDNARNNLDDVERKNLVEDIKKSVEFTRRSETELTNTIKNDLAQLSSEDVTGGTTTTTATEAAVAAETTTSAFTPKQNLSIETTNVTGVFKVVDSKGKALIELKAPNIDSATKKLNNIIKDPTKYSKTYKNLFEEKIPAAPKAAKVEKPTAKPAEPTIRAYGREIQLTRANGYEPVQAANGEILYRKVGRVGTNRKGDVTLVTNWYDSQGNKMSSEYANSLLAKKPTPKVETVPLKTTVPEVKRPAFLKEGYEVVQRERIVNGKKTTQYILRDASGKELRTLKPSEVKTFRSYTKARATAFKTAQATSKLEAAAVRAKTETVKTKEVASIKMPKDGESVALKVKSLKEGDVVKVGNENYTYRKTQGTKFLSPREELVPPKMSQDSLVLKRKNGSLFAETIYEAPKQTGRAEALAKGTEKAAIDRWMKRIKDIEDKIPQAKGLTSQINEATKNMTDAEKLAFIDKGMKEWIKSGEYLKAVAVAKTNASKGQLPAKKIPTNQENISFAYAFRSARNQNRFTAVGTGGDTFSVTATVPKNVKTIGGLVKYLYDNGNINEANKIVKSLREMAERTQKRNAPDKGKFGLTKLNEGGYISGGEPKKIEKTKELAQDVTAAYEPSKAKEIASKLKITKGAKRQVYSDIGQGYTSVPLEEIKTLPLASYESFQGKAKDLVAQYENDWVTRPEYVLDVIDGKIPPTNRVQQRIYTSIVQNNLQRGASAEEWFKVNNQTHLANTQADIETSYAAQNLSFVGLTAKGHDINAIIKKIEGERIGAMGDAFKSKLEEGRAAINKFTPEATVEQVTRILESYKSDKVRPLLQAFASGKLSIKELTAMTPDERLATLKGIVGEEYALKFASDFEKKLLLKNQKIGLLNWLNSVTGVDNKIKNDLYYQIQKLDRVLDPSNAGKFDNFIHTALGVRMTAEQQITLHNLMNKMLKYQNEAAAVYSKDGKTITTKEYLNATKGTGGLRKKGWERTPEDWKYGIAQADLIKYLQDVRSGNFKQWYKEARAEGLIPLTGKATILFNDLLRGLLASFDNSFLLRQGGRTARISPSTWLKSAGKSYEAIGRTLFKKGGGRDAERLMMAYILSDPWSELANSKGLAVLSKDDFFPELKFISPGNWKGIGRMYKASELGYDTAAQVMRLELFKKWYVGDVEKFAKRGIELRKDHAENLATYINFLTGRGSLGKLERNAGTLNLAFFSARFTKSQWDNWVKPFSGRKIGGWTYKDAQNVTRWNPVQKRAAANLLWMAAHTASLIVIANALKPGSAELDPRSADFGKIRIGDTRFDITGGAGQIPVLMARTLPSLFNGMKFYTKNSSTQLLTELNSNEFGSKNAFDVAVDFFTNKLPPLSGRFVAQLKNQDINRMPPSFWRSLRDLVFPLSIQNFLEASANPKAANRWVSSFFDLNGIAANTYSAAGGGRAGVSWETSKEKDVIAFRAKVGEDEFKIAGKKADDRFNRLMTNLLDNPTYREATPKTKNDLIRIAKNKIQEDIFREYGFKYKAQTMTKTERARIENLINQNL